MRNLWNNLLFTSVLLLLLVLLFYFVRTGLPDLFGGKAEAGMEAEAETELPDSLPEEIYEPAEEEERDGELMENGEMPLVEAEETVEIREPAVPEGELSESGIPEEAIELIGDIITADIGHGFSSAQLAVIKDGKLVYRNAWGKVQTIDEQGDPVSSAEDVTDETLYDLASNTKMYSVNYALQYLLTRGEVDLDTRITDILGQEFAEDTIDIAYQGFDPIPAETNRAWKASLTIRDLLKHEAGFPEGPQYYNDRYDHASREIDSDNGNVLYAGTDGSEATREYTRRLICRTPLMYEPHTKTLYSDLDYMILCYCLEEITGMRLDEYLKQTFWEPMGLTRTTYNPLENGFTEADCAATEPAGNSRDRKLSFSGVRTYTLRGEVHDPNAFYCMSGVSGHAGMFSTATELAYLASLMLDGTYGEQEYFSREVIGEFTAPKDAENDNFGLGWWRQGDHRRDSFFGTQCSEKTFGHQGFTGTLTMIDPEDRLIVVLLTNKIHSTTLGDSLSKFRGNYYTTARLGFAPEIIQTGEKNPDDPVGALESLMQERIDAAEENAAGKASDYPVVLAYEALKEAEESFEERFGTAGSIQQPGT